MSFKAKTIRKTQVVSIRRPPQDVAKGAAITVFDEAGGWGLVDVKIGSKVVTGEMPSEDYRRVAGGK